jgi:predicted enzyme related to lactoylglutathione lyase
MPTWIVLLPAAVDEVDLAGERVEAGAGGLVEEQGDVGVGRVLHAEGPECGELVVVE